MDDIVIYMLVLGLLILSGRVDSLQKTVAHMNSTLFKIAKQVGITEPPLDEQLKILVNDGKKIQAIKELRKSTGLGLKEAKDYVDNL